MQDPEKITYFAETDARNKKIPFGIKAKDRSRHVYVIGKTGMGKSTLLENMAIQDIQNGNGVAFIDPHGKTTDLLMEYVPEDRIKDVLYFAPFDMDFPVSFNVMEDVGYDKRHLVASGLMSAFKKIWQDVWSARMEYILSNALLALLEYPNSTLLSVNRLLSDKKFRDEVVSTLKDEAVKSFWVDEFANYTERMQAESVPAIQNKIGQFTSNPVIRNIVGQPKSTFDFRDLMDNRKIVIINLSKGRIGESNAQLLGSMIVTKIYLAAMSRADVSEADLQNLPNFYLFVDEFQSFANESFADILSEARKYKLNLTITHQYIEQMPEEVRAAVFGNVGTLVSFRVGAADAEYLEKEFAPTFTAEDIVNLGFTQIYLRLMINGVGSQPFSARTMPPIEKPEKSYFKEIVDSSRKSFGNPREEVEAQIKKLIEDSRVENGNKNNKNNGGKNKNKNGNKNNGPRDIKPAFDANTKAELLKYVDQQKKEVINEIPEDNPIEKETLSLRQLGKPPKKDDTKTATPEHKESLRNALAAALGDSFTAKQEEKKEDVPKENKSQTDAQKIDLPKEKPQTKLQEVAEEELKKILEVEEN